MTYLCKAFISTWKMNRFCHFLAKRFYSSQAAAKGKSSLAVLRKKTGFAIGKCREALTKHNEDLEAAENWLYAEAKKEGWAKVEKLKDRVAQQGLIGMLIQSNENKAVMIEVNCETDFVARNSNFQDLISTIVQTTFDHRVTRLLQDTPMPVVDYLSKDLIGSIPASEEQTLADRVAETVGQLGENISISRGYTVSASQGLICGFAYNSVSPADSGIQLGTYGALLHMLPVEGSEVSNPEDLRRVGQQVCQHVVGMDMEEVSAKGNKDIVGVLSEQTFLFDSSICVGELLARNRVSVTKVIRYALGETDSIF